MILLLTVLLVYSNLKIFIAEDACKSIGQVDFAPIDAILDIGHIGNSGDTVPKVGVLLFVSINW